MQYKTKATKLVTRGIFADGKLTGVYLSGKGATGDEFSIEVDGEVFNRTMQTHLQRILDQRLAGIESLLKVVRKDREKRFNDLLSLDAALMTDVRKALGEVSHDLPIDGDKAQARIEDLSGHPEIDPAEPEEVPAR